MITVAGKPGTDVPVGTLKAILKTARLLKLMLMKYTVIFEKGPSSWGACIPDLPGVIAAAKTRKAVERLIREAASLHLKSMREEGQTLPVAASFAAEIELLR